MSKPLLGFICGLIDRQITRIYATTASEEWVIQYGVMATYRAQNLSPNLAVALVF
jgi:hypothetical protein